jgi:hypothetical protein
VVLVLSAQAVALAQASGDGRQGPRVFGDAALDESLLAMNGFLRARYVNDDIMASLQQPPRQRDFFAVARAVSDVPELTSMRVVDGFGPAVTDGRSLDLQLVSFNADLDRRGDALFVRVARAAGGTGLGFAEVAAVPPVLGEEVGFGPAIWNDPTLDNYMLALIDQMIDQAGRNAELAISSPAVDTGSSFDRYGQSLTLY